MLGDFTALDSLAFEALKNALNRRVVVNSVRLVPSVVNRVWVVETDVRPVVVKRFFSGKAGVEFETLLRVRPRGLPVPLPYWKDGEYLVEEYVEGEGCDRLINQMFRSDVAEMIGAWLAGFHSALREDDRDIVVGDVALGDFIVSEGRVFCVDLEDTGPGDPIEDLGGLSARILGSEPFFTPIKFELCSRLITSYENASGTDARERVRPHISRRLRADARRKPLFRRTLVAAAKGLDRGWPELP
jgi:tRNA A-37 threonylcarbamoyl transferase component Bud32